MENGLRGSGKTPSARSRRLPAMAPSRDPGFPWDIRTSPTYRTRNNESGAAPDSIAKNWQNMERAENFCHGLPYPDLHRVRSLQNFIRIFAQTWSKILRFLSG